MCHVERDEEKAVRERIIHQFNKTKRKLAARAPVPGSRLKELLESVDAPAETDRSGASRPMGTMRGETLTVASAEGGPNATDTSARGQQTPAATAFFSIHRNTLHTVSRAATEKVRT